MAEITPRFNQLNLVVADMAASVAFYRRLGLNIPDAVPEWAAHHRTVEQEDDTGIDLDLDSIEFARTWDQGWSDHPRRAGVLGFAVSTRDAVDDLYRDLTSAGYVGEQPPHDAFFGSRYAIVQDPDGNPVGLMSPRDASRRSVQGPPQ